MQKKLIKTEESVFFLLYLVEINLSFTVKKVGMDGLSGIFFYIRYLYRIQYTALSFAGYLIEYLVLFSHSLPVAIFSAV